MAWILDEDFCVVQQKVLEEDPFRDTDPQMEDNEEDIDLLDLMACVQGENSCLLDGYCREDKFEETPK